MNSGHHTPGEHTPTGTRGRQFDPLSTQYGQGVRDGFEITLKLLLGVPESGGNPYRGPMPDELRLWIDAALMKIAESK